MNKLVKTAVAGALALGATSAFAIGIPSTNNSDLILYVDALTSSGTSAGVYAIDTSISLSSLMPGGFVSGATNNSTTFPGTSAALSSSGLSAFIASSTTSGDTIKWTLEGGQYAGAGTYAQGTSSSAQNSNAGTPGSALAIFTSPALTGNLPHAPTSSTVALQNFLNGLQADYTQGGLTGLQNNLETTGTEFNGGQSKYGFINGPDLSSTGTAVDLFGFTANAPGTLALQSYILGSATLSAAGVLTINPNAPTAVPLPAAVWLFGSGLMGLVGVSRRRKAEAAAKDSLDQIV